MLYVPNDTGVGRNTRGPNLAVKSTVPDIIMLSDEVDKTIIRSSTSPDIFPIMDGPLRAEVLLTKVICKDCNKMTGGELTDESPIRGVISKKQESGVD